MAQDATEVVVGLGGHVYVAGVGNTVPTTTATPWPAGWHDLGYTSEDGLTINFSQTFNEKRGWPSPDVMRTWINQREFSVGFTLIQFNSKSLILALGGGTVDVVTGSIFRYTPDDGDTPSEFALGCEWTDGADIYRLIVRRAMVSEPVSFVVNRQDSVDLPITAKAMVPTSGLMWEIVTNDADFIVAS